MKIKRIGLISLIILFIISYFTYATSDQFEVHFLNVGQADCILIHTPNNKNMLIDAGNNGDKNFIIDYLQKQDVSKIDVLIGTHPHEDHIGSLDTIINNFDIGQIYMPKVSSNTKTFKDVILAVKAKGLNIKIAKAGTAIKFDAEIKTEVLAPVSEHYEDLNNYSAVIKLTYQNFSFLFTGDAETVSENEMLKNNYDLKSNFLKVGHHGSDSSTSSAFLKAVNPQYALISVGAGNKYGHPEEAVLNRLKKFGTKVIRTDQQGTVVVTLDKNNNISINTSKKIKGSVNLKKDRKIKIKQDEKKEIIVYITPKGKKYHQAGCRYLARSSIPISKEKAQSSGYLPCKVCRP